MLSHASQLTRERVDSMGEEIKETLSFFVEAKQKKNEVAAKTWSLLLEYERGILEEYCNILDLEEARDQKHGFVTPEKEKIRSDVGVLERLIAETFAVFGPGCKLERK